MPKITEKKIRETADLIAREYNPEKIILFGSYAWGEPTQDSDVDLFIVKDDEKKPIEMMRDVNRILLGRDFAADILVYTMRQTIKRDEMADPFIRKILRSGKVLYEKQ